MALAAPGMIGAGMQPTPSQVFERIKVAQTQLGGQ